jgi:hypothetical protein
VTNFNTVTCSFLSSSPNEQPHRNTIGGQSRVDNGCYECPSCSGRLRLGTLGTEPGSICLSDKKCPNDHYDGSNRTLRPPSRFTLIFSPQIVEFTSGFLKFKPAEKKKLEQKGKTVLEPYKSLRESVVNLLWPRVCHPVPFHGQY